MDGTAFSGVLHDLLSRRLLETTQKTVRSGLIINGTAGQKSFVCSRVVLTAPCARELILQTGPDSASHTLAHIHEWARYLHLRRMHSTARVHVSRFGTPKMRRMFRCLVSARAARFLEGRNC